jgi:hypothetical protein
MAKRKGQKPAKPSKPKLPAPEEDVTWVVPPEEAADIAATRKALEPLVEKGISAHRLASACGAHPEDLRGFLSGRVSLTPALRARLRVAVPSIVESLSAPRETPPE